MRQASSGVCAVPFVVEHEVVPCSISDRTRAQQRRSTSSWAGRKDCEWGMGPLRKCGVFDLQKLAERQTTRGSVQRGVRGGLAKVRCVAVGGP